MLVIQSCPTLCDPWTVACQSPLSMEFSGQDYWSWVAMPFSRDLPDPGIEPRSLALQSGSLPYKPPRKPNKTYNHGLKFRGKNQRCFKPWHSFSKIKHLYGIQIKWKARQYANDFLSLLRIQKHFHHSELEFDSDATDNVFNCLEICRKMQPS